MKVTLQLRAEHRNIEQALAILCELCDLRHRDFEDLAAAMLEHLDIEEHIVFPIVERTTARELDSELAEHEKLRAAISSALDASIDRSTLRRRITYLALAFSAHVLRQDGTLYSYLEEISSARGLEELALAVTSFRYASVPAYRFGASGRSAAE